MDTKNHGRSSWHKKVIEGEVGFGSTKLTSGLAGDIIYNESGQHSPAPAEFAQDVTHKKTQTADNSSELKVDTAHKKAQIDNSSELKVDTAHKKAQAKNNSSEFAVDEGIGEDVNVGVTENAPYHNMAKYKMVQQNDQNINTQSS